MGLCEKLEVEFLKLNQISIYFSIRMMCYTNCQSLKLTILIFNPKLWLIFDGIATKYCPRCPHYEN